MTDPTGKLPEGQGDTRQDVLYAHLIAADMLCTGMVLVAGKAGV